MSALPFPYLIQTLHPGNWIDKISRLHEHISLNREDVDRPNFTPITVLSLQKKNFKKRSDPLMHCCEMCVSWKRQKAK